MRADDAERAAANERRLNDGVELTRLLVERKLVQSEAALLASKGIG